MVCKEDVVSWFKNLKSHTRIDVMCNLFNLCLPFELRFLGTCLEDLGKRDFHDLRTTESGANNPSELSSPDLQCISDKRARTKLALYISLLHSCNYACSNGYYKILANVEEVNNLIKCNGVSSAEDDVLEELLLIYTLALNHPAFTFEQKLFLGDVFTKLQQEEGRRSLRRTRSSQGLTGVEVVDKLQVYQPCASPDQIPLLPSSSIACTPMTPAALTGDPLVSMQEPVMGYMGFSLMAGYHPAAMMLPPPPAEQRSPMVSRTGSPCQSNSPSRASSPVRPAQSSKAMPPTFNRPPPLPGDVGKHLALEQLRRLTDDELRDKGFNNPSISQLRSLPNTNGYNLSGKKMPLVEPEPHNDVSAGPLRRYNSADGPLNPPQFYYCAQNCATCQRDRTPPTKLPLANQMKSLSLDHDSGSLQNSSGSDSASDRDHSPPDTPDTRLTATPDRVVGAGLVDVWEEQHRISEAIEERRPGLGAGQGRARGGGRNRAPGIQTLPRGRGHNPPQRRRDANGSVEDRKLFSNETGGGGMAFPYPAQFIPPNHFIPYPSFTAQAGVYRLPFLNGDIMYHAIPPPAAQQFLSARPAPPPPLSFSPLVPPPKISCYNCGSQNHIGTECPEATIEEITNKGQYRIDYSNNLAFPVNKPGECPTTQDK